MAEHRRLLQKSPSYFSSKHSSDLTSQLYKITVTETPGNAIFSPLGTLLTLSALAHAGEGTTAKEIIDYLQIDFPEFHTECETLIKYLRVNSAVQLHMSFAGFIHEDIVLREKFDILMKNSYHFYFLNIYFNNKVQATDLINSWTTILTQNKVQILLTPDDIDEDTSILMLNTIYFRGIWRNQFSAQFTRNCLFHIDNNNTKLVPTMMQTFYFYYGDLCDLKAKFIQLPFKREEFEMIIILPNEIDGLADIEKKFDWHMIRKSKKSCRLVCLHLPKFSIETTVDLKKMFNTIGIKTLFKKNEADFDGLAEFAFDDPIYVNTITQKAFANVTEAGTEDAEITISRLLGGGNGDSPDVIKFFVDRPFIVALNHKLCDIPLLLGSIRDIDIN